MGVAVAAGVVVAAVASAAAICDCVRPEAAAAAAAKDAGVAVGVAVVDTESVVGDVSVGEGVGVVSAGGEAVCVEAAEAAAVRNGDCVSGVAGSGVAAADGVGAEEVGASAGEGSGVEDIVDGQQARKLPELQAMLPEPVVQVEVGS